MRTVLPAVHGRINDLDSHRQVPASQWGEVFGEATARLAEQFLGNHDAVLRWTQAGSGRLRPTALLN